MNIYLAIACDKALSDPKRMSNILISDFYSYGGDITIFSPANAFSVIGNNNNSRQFTKYLFRINMHALHRADILLVYYEPGTVTWGVPMEVSEFYKSKDNPLIYLFTDKMVGYGKLPAYLAHFVKITHCFFRNEGHGTRTMINQMWGEYRRIP